MGGASRVEGLNDSQMNWIQENKFLAGVIGVTAVGACGLGWMIFSTSGQLSEAQTEFQTATRELNRLQTAEPFPSDKNLKELKTQYDELMAATTKFQKEIAALELPLEKDLQPQTFQDNLRTSVNRLTAKATANRSTFDGEFFLGFDLYRGSVPVPAATPYLARDLKVIEWAIDTILDQKEVQSIKIERSLIPEEPGGTPKVEVSKSSGPSRDAKPKTMDAPRYKAHTVKFSFEAEQERFRAVLNAITTYQKQFLVVRNLAIKNQKQDGPPKVDPNAVAGEAVSPPADAVAADGTPVPPKPAGPKKPVVGEELLEVTMTLDIVDFADPEEPTTGPKSRGTAADKPTSKPSTR